MLSEYAATRPIAQLKDDRDFCKQNAVRLARSGRADLARRYAQMALDIQEAIDAQVNGTEYPPKG